MSLQEIKEKPKYRNVGSAASRYVNESLLPFRENVTKAIKKLSRRYLQKHKLTGASYYLKKSEQLKRRADRYRCCGHEYFVLKCEKCDSYYIGPSRCESRICPACCWKYGMRIRKKQEEILKRLPRTQTKRIMFLTLTKTVNPDREPNYFDVKKLNEDGRKVINILYPNKKGCGGLSVIEIGPSKNLHLHALVYGDYHDQRMISRLWLKITGDSIIVHIREVRDVKKGLDYSLKYISKPPQSTDPDKLAIYLDAITGIRRIHTYGILYNFPLCKKEPYPCAFCGGKLTFLLTDSGSRIPEGALFFYEVVDLARTV